MDKNYFDTERLEILITFQVEKISEGILGGI